MKKTKQRRETKHNIGTLKPVVRKITKQRERRETQS